MLSKICQYLKPISISLSPNTEKDDVWLAFRLLFQPRFWICSINSTTVSNILHELETAFQKYLGVKHTFAFNSGRSALMAILDALCLQKGDEILLQAFTCNAVPNPIIWAGLKPVYVDCNEDDFNIDAEDLEKKITSRSKAVIVQHTFGLSADVDKILEVCKKYNVILIEDCAHAFGARYKGKLVGTFGKAAFFSFSRDKVISCVYGGTATTSDDTLGGRIKAFQERIGRPSPYWVLQQLLHPVLLNWKILPTYRILGKYILVLAQWLLILSKAVHWKEKRGERPDYFPKRMPDALAVLALNQLGKLQRFNNHRREIAKFYREQLQQTSFELPREFKEREHIFLRFSLKHLFAHKIIKKAWAKNLLIGDWYNSPVAPRDTQLDKMGYALGSCPKAEKLAKITLNLPTHIHISKHEVYEIVTFLKSVM